MDTRKKKMDTIRKDKKMDNIRKDKKMDTIRRDKKMDTIPILYYTVRTSTKHVECTETVSKLDTMRKKMMDTMGTKREEEKTWDGIADSDTGLRRRCKQVLVLAAVTHSDINVKGLTRP